MDKILIVIDNKMKQILQNTQSFEYLLYQFEEIEQYTNIIFSDLKNDKYNIVNYINENNFHKVFLIDTFKYDDFSLLQYDDISIHYNNKFDENEITAMTLYNNFKDKYITEVKKYKNNMIMNQSLATTIKITVKEKIANDLEIYENIVNLFWRD